MAVVCSIEPWSGLFFPPPSPPVMGVQFRPRSGRGAVARASFLGCIVGPNPRSGQNPPALKRNCWVVIICRNSCGIYNISRAVNVCVFCVHCAFPSLAPLGGREGGGRAIFLRLDLIRWQ